MTGNTIKVETNHIVSWISFHVYIFNILFNIIKYVYNNNLKDV